MIGAALRLLSRGRVLDGKALGIVGIAVFLGAMIAEIRGQSPRAARGRDDGGSRQEDDEGDDDE